MATREALHQILVSILGTNSVYYQPPAGFTIQYPCIVYHLDDIQKLNADNITYRLKHRYSVTYMTSRSPNQIIIDKLTSMPLSKFNTRFINENIYHTVFTIYF